MKSVLFILIVAGGLAASQPSTSDPVINAALNELSSPVLDVRMAAFYSIIDAGLQTDTDSKFPVKDGVLSIARSSAASRARLVEALTNLLELETDLVSAESATEEYSNYHGDVIWAVSTLRDPSSLHALMRNVNTGGMAQDALTSFGDPALTAALKALPNADEETRSNLFGLFAGMAEPRNMNNLKSAESRAALLNVLLAGTKESDPFFRKTSIAGLSYFSSPEAVEALERLATSDSFKITDPDATIRHPVRETAAKALQEQDQTLQKQP